MEYIELVCLSRLSNSMITRPIHEWYNHRVQVNRRSRGVAYWCLTTICQSIVYLRESCTSTIVQALLIILWFQNMLLKECIDKCLNMVLLYAEEQPDAR